MEARILQSSSCCFSSLNTAFSSGSVNRHRFSSIAPSPKPLSVSFPPRTRTSRAPFVLSMSKKDDGTEKDDSTESLTYKDSGVDIDAGTELVRRIAKMAPGIGGFGGLFPLGIPKLYLECPKFSFFVAVVVGLLLNKRPLSCLALIHFACRGFISRSWYGWCRD